MRLTTLKQALTRVFGMALMTTLLGLGQPAMAADDPPRGPNMDRLSQELSLSQEQAREMEEILEQNRERRRELMTEYRGSGNREAARTEMEALRKDTDQQLSGVLNEKQLEQFQAQRRERRAEWQSKHHGTRAGGRGGEGGQRPRNGGR